MELTLDRIAKRVGAEHWLYELSLTPVAGQLTVLLGATSAGKTTLLRLMAGLDPPSDGRILVDGRDVTGVPVRQRNVAMVYQQFINYPSLTVFDNIASPLRVAGIRDVDGRVRQLAARLHIDGLLDRLPAELSGGQQQRVALARALAKGAPLMLLDEPLVNLDYKLREQLRDELAQLFTSTGSTVIYATTEPSEALLLGGYCAVLDAGELLQYGPTAAVYRQPRSLRVARAFSDPPMNLFNAHYDDGGGIRIEHGPRLELARPAASGARCTVGLRAAALRLDPRPGDLTVQGAVALTELSGSDSFIHLSSPMGPVVAQLTGVHEFEPGAALPLYVAATDAYVFDANGQLQRSPGAAREC